MSSATTLPTTKIRRAICYARFSPRPDAKSCESCESQQADLSAYAKREGYIVCGQYNDRDVSGGDNWEDRPGLYEAAHACKRGDTLLVRTLDRLFRDTAKALSFVAMMQARGVKVISALEPHANVETPMGKFMQTIMLAFAELYREMCRARTKIKMREHQQNGRRMSCRPPFGWMLDPADKKAIIPSPVEQAILKKMRALREAGESSYCIARSLEAARVKHPRSGQVYWSHQLIENIFSRDDYVTSLGKPREA